MHTADLLDEAIALAERLGYRVRPEWLGGTNGGGCEIRGHRWIFLDLALGPGDQLEQVLATLRREPAVANLPMPQLLRDCLLVRKSA
jgi:hypothetical protein